MASANCGVGRELPDAVALGYEKRCYGLLTIVESRETPWIRTVSQMASYRIRRIGSWVRLSMRMGPERQRKHRWAPGSNRTKLTFFTEKDLHRLDPTGEEHGVLAQLLRSLIRIAGPAEGFKHLSRHVDDVRAGRYVIMVLVKEREKRHVAADILNSHGAEFVGFYGRWAWQSWTPHPLTLRTAEPATRNQRRKKQGRRIWRPTRHRDCLF